MSWICEMCSTANEGSDTTCFVCGYERSKEELREAKRAEREERAKHKREKAYKITNIIGIILFFSSIISFSVVTLIVLFLKVKNGSVGDVVNNFIALLENIWENIKLMFAVNAKSMIVQLKNSPLSFIGGNYMAIRSRAINTIQNDCGCIITELFVDKGIKYETVLQKLIFFKDAVLGSFKHLGSFIVTLAVKIGENIVDIIDNVKEIIQKVKEVF